ncbi:organic anion transporter 3-like [Ornithodoros turicata]|uniref:organic anion transporter 3-like n=1 Tax=Ornithodoros turicata TaxID=34597 RepID=UPI00313A2269
MSSKQSRSLESFYSLGPKGASARPSKASSSSVRGSFTSESSRSLSPHAPKRDVGTITQRAPAATGLETKPGVPFGRMALPSSQSLPALPFTSGRPAIQGPTSLAAAHEEPRSTLITAQRSPSQQSASSVSQHLDEHDQLEQATIYGHGLYQRAILFSSVLSLVVLLCHSSAFRVIARGVDFWCARPPSLQNLSVAEWKNFAIPFEPDGSRSRCKVYDDPFGQNKTAIECTTWEYESLSLSIVSTWNLVCSREWRLRLAALTYTMGAVIAAPLMGIVADKIGRRPVICIAVGVLLFASFVTCLATDITVFVCARCVVSGCASTIFVTTFVLLLEVTDAEHRALYCIVSTSLAITVTSTLFFVLEEFQRIRWRIAQAIFVGITCLLVSSLYIDESPRWLLATCKFTQAEKAILWAAKVNGVRLERVRTRCSRLKTAILKNEEYLKVTPLALFTYPLLRVRCSLLFLCWFVIVFSFHVFKAPVGVEKEERWAKIASVAAPGPLIAVVYCAMRTKGRKTTIAIALGLLGCCSSALLFRYPPSLRHLTNFFLVTARVTTYIATAVNYIYAAEMFPTVLRSVGVCTAYFFGRLGAATGNALTQVNVSPQVTLAVLTVLVLVAELALIKLPETRSAPLVNTIRQLETQDYKKYLKDTLPESYGRVPSRGTKSGESMPLTPLWSPIVGSHVPGSLISPREIYATPASGLSRE